MIKDKEIIQDKEIIPDKEMIQDRKMFQEMMDEIMQDREIFPRFFEDKLVAIGKVDSDGTLLRGTRGITVSAIPVDGMYRVEFPEGLVQSDDYIVQLTAENFFDDADAQPTIIGLHYQSRNGFNVSIWARRESDHGFGPVQTPWSFTIYDRRPILIREPRLFELQ